MNRILVISLSNIGDVVLTFPVLDILKKDFPEAKLSVVIGPKAASLLQGNLNFDQVYVFDKHQSGPEKLKWIARLRQQTFDLVVDLRNTFIPFLIKTKQRTSLFPEKMESVHMKIKHLRRLETVYPYSSESLVKYSVYVNEDDKKSLEVLTAATIGPADKMVIIAPGAADEAKRWPEQRYAETADKLIEARGYKIVFVGDGDKDQRVTTKILSVMRHPALNLCGKLTLAQSGELMKSAVLVLGNDSGPMHLASYLNRPTVTLFGPTDPQKYGAWSTQACCLKKEVPCRRCRDKDSTDAHTCLNAITVEDVLDKLKTWNMV